MKSDFIEFSTYYLKSEYLKGLSGYDYIVLILLIDANGEVKSNLLYELLTSGKYKAMKKITFLKCLERLKDRRLIKLKEMRNSNGFSCMIENKKVTDTIYIERKIIDYLMEHSLKMIDLKIYFCILKDNIIKQSEIADILGTKQSHISEALKRLENAGAIEIKKVKIQGLYTNRYYFNNNADNDKTSYDAYNSDDYGEDDEMPF